MNLFQSPSNAADEDSSETTAAPGWFVTYADMMSLLLTFFILLASMSELRSEPRVVQAVDSLQRQFGEQMHRGETGDGPAENQFRPNVPPRQRTSMGERNSAVGGAVVFAEETAELSEPERRRLAAIFEQFRGKTQRIEIRGHSSRRPLPAASDYADHWDLAYARCREVLQLAVDAGIEGRRMRLSVAGGNEPVHLGDETRESRDNSRVELFLLSDFADGNEKAGAAPSSR